MDNPIQQSRDLSSQSVLKKTHTNLIAIILVCGLVAFSGILGCRPNSGTESVAYPETIEAVGGSLVDPPKRENVATDKFKVEERTANIPNPEPHQASSATEKSVEDSTIDEPRTFEYSSQPTTAPEYVQGRIDYDKVALHQFQHSVLPNLEPAQQEFAEGFVTDTLKGLIEPKNIAKWKGLLRRLKRIDDQSESFPTVLADDPLWLACQGIVLGINQFQPAGLARLEQALDRLPQSEYSQQTKVLLHLKYFQLYHPNLSGNVDSRLQGLNQALLNWFAADFYVPPHQHRYVVDDAKEFIVWANEFEKNQLLEEFYEKFNQLFELPPWIRHMVRGHYQQIPIDRSLIWDQKQGWMVINNRPLREFLQRAADFFRNAHSVNPMFPEAAGEMMKLATYRKEEKEIPDWYQKAIAAQPDYMPVHRLMLDSFRADRDGTVEQMLEYTRKTINESADDSILPFLLIATHQRILDAFPENDEQRIAYVEDPQHLRDLIQAIDRITAQVPCKAVDNQIVPDSSWLTLKTVWAVQLAEYDQADRSMWSLDETFDQRAIAQLGVENTTFNVFRSGPYARVSEFESEATELVELFGETPAHRMLHSDQIINLTEQVLVENSHPLGSLFFRMAQQQVLLERAFQRGDMVKLPFDSDLSMWRGKSVNRVNFENEDAARIDQRISDQSFDLWSIIYTPGNKSIEFEIEFLEDEFNSSVNLPTPWVSLVFGEYRESKIGIGIRQAEPDDTLEPESDGTSGSGSNDSSLIAAQVRFGDIAYPERAYYYDIMINRGRNNLKINAYEQYFEFFLNDEFVFRTKSNHLRQAVDYIGLVQTFANSGSGVTRISNFFVSQLNDPPPPFAAPVELLVDYYLRQVDRFPDDRWFRFWYGKSLHQAGRWELALEQYQSALELGLSEGTVGFFLGDIYEQQLDWEHAIAWYQRAANPEFDNPTRLQPRGRRNNYSNPQNWAAWRLDWLQSTSPDPDVRAKHVPKNYVPAMAPEQSYAFNYLTKAQRLAIQGEYPQAVKSALELIPFCSSELEPHVIKIIHVYRQGQIYQRTDVDELPIYRMAKAPLKFFRHFIDYLPIHDAARF